MRPRDVKLAERLAARLRSFSRRKRTLPGIRASAKRSAFVEQLVESMRRVRYVSVIRGRKISGRRGDPNDELFDPVKAALLRHDGGDVEEAFWLVFLFVQFGKNARGGWRYAREIYGRLGGPLRWDWTATSVDPSAFRQWLDAHQEDLKREGVPGGFGNHRKYESLDAYSPNGTGATVESYVRWVGPPRTHQQLMADALEEAAGDSRTAFYQLYKSMKNIARFGRTARFDYLTMIGKLGLAPIEPGSVFMVGATGPAEGARLLFGARKAKLRDFDEWLVELGAHLGVGMQELEDALCNWQKSPEKFVPFRG